MNIELCRKFFASVAEGEVFAGFSGGADSTAALLTALYFQQEYRYRITAVHFDHHLRGDESDADARWCRMFAQKHDIPFQKIDLCIKPGRGMENAARLERLKWWKKLAGNHPKCAVVLGHHGDDRLENFFIRFLRGSNAGGLVSPKPFYRMDGIDFIRPLLCFSRSEIEKFLLDQNVDWRTDSTNKIADCSRNFIRLETLPGLFKLFPGARTGAMTCLEALEQDADFIEQMADLAFDKEKLSSRTYLKSLHPALLARVIRKWKNEIPGREFLHRLSQELQRPAPHEQRSIPWSDTEFLCFRNDRVFWHSGAKLLPTGEVSWELTTPEIYWGNWLFSVEEAGDTVAASKYEAVFDADKLGGELVITPPCPGEKMTVFGSGKTEKIKKLRVDSKIPSGYNLPVLKNQHGTIVWAPGIRHSALAAVNETTSRKIRLKAESLEFGIGDRID